jgi:hypothetical protein
MDGHAKPSAAAVSLHTQPIRSEIVSVVIKVLKVLAGSLVALVAVLTLTFYLKPALYCSEAQLHVLYQGT